jgi:tyrosine-specific transport protein
MVKRITTLIGTGALLLGAASIPGASAYQAVPMPNYSMRTPKAAAFRQQSAFTSKRTSNMPLHAGYEDDKYPPPQGRKRDHPLKAAAFSDAEQESLVNLGMFESYLLPVLSASMLITGNTVGAGCLVLPDMAAQTGFGTATGIFLAAFAVNLVSGLVLAEVAIKQKESAGTDVPSSFKEFAEVSLESPEAANAISGVSLFVNSCVLAFDLSRAGSVGSGVVGGLLAPNVMTLGWASVLVGLLATQTSAKLTNVASMFVGALFLSFGGLLIPGLAAVHDPVATLTQPGLSDDLMDSVGHAAPVILMSLVYQNIVPTIAKILDYDRVKTVSSIVLGSLIPLLMYLGWCYACLGGGIDRSVGLGGGEIMAVFSMSTLAGSSLASTISLAEEVDNFVQQEPPKEKESSEYTDNSYGVSSVLASIALPLTAALACAGGDSINEALSLAGSFGSPLLYGAIPAVMALKQRENAHQQGQQQDLVPGFSLGLLGLASSGFMGEELMQRLGDMTAFAS